MMPYQSDPWVKYQYKLNENFTDNCDAKQLEGTTLKKDVWTIFPQKIEHLSKYIKTIENEQGIVDYECFHQIKGEIYDSSANNFNKLKEGKTPFYKRDTLASFPRHQLEEICHLFNIDTARRVNKILVNDILEKQQVLREILKKSK